MIGHDMLCCRETVVGVDAIVEEKFFQEIRGGQDGVGRGFSAPDDAANVIVDTTVKNDIDLFLSSFACCTQATTWTVREQNSVKKQNGSGEPA